MTMLRGTATAPSIFGACTQTARLRPPETTTGRALPCSRCVHYCAPNDELFIGLQPPFLSRAERGIRKAPAPSRTRLRVPRIVNRAERWMILRVLGYLRVSFHPSESGILNSREQVPAPRNLISMCEDHIQIPAMPGIPARLRSFGLRVRGLKGARRQTTKLDDRTARH